MRLPFAALALLLAAAPAAAQKADAQKAGAKPDSTGTYELSAVTAGPRPLNLQDLLLALEATYPPELRAARVGGEVLVRFRLDTKGFPHELKVMRSTESQFDAPTLEAVRKLRFSPAELEGRPVQVWVVLPIQWSVSET